MEDAMSEDVFTDMIEDEPSDTPTPEADYVPFGPEWEAFVMKLPKKMLIKQLREACINYNGASRLSAFHLDKALQIADEQDQLRAINAELLESLQWYVDNDESFDDEDQGFWATGQRKADAVIAKAKEAQS